MYKIEKTHELKDLVTFGPNKGIPIYNWFYYKEGYSRDFVNYFIDEFNINKDDTVLDPFMGTGTTLLTCKENGINSIGGDIMPLLVFVSKVKTRDYDTEELRKMRKWIKAQEFTNPDLDISDYVKKFYPPRVLEDIIHYKNIVEEIKDEKIRDFFKLVLINYGFKNSWIYRDGAVTKVRKRPVASFKKSFSNGSLRMIKDMERTEFGDCKTEVKEMNAKNLDVEDESIDYIITSPPYLAKKEYSKIYDIENELYFDNKLEFDKNIVGSSDEYEDPFPKQELPGNSKRYFYDMWMTIREMYRVLKPSGKVALNISSGVVDDSIVVSDLFLGKLAEREGFEVEKIIEAKTRVATTSEREKIGEIRESVLILKKN